MTDAALHPGSVCDVPGLAVGHFTDARRPTGCSVVLCHGVAAGGAVAGVAVRGGAPGTRETDLLRPENTVGRVHAVLLTGGSAFGLDAASGVMRWLEARRVGLPVGPARVPIVPAAVLFDLWVGDASIRPDGEAGFAACEAAAAQAPAQGSIGAGAGATVGKLFGLPRAMKGGIGSASLRLGPVTVAALVAVNAVGDVLGEDGTPLAGARDATGTRRLGSRQALLQGDGPARGLAGTATTIGVVATNALLDKAQATQLAHLAHAGLARCIDPITPHDGDTLFALATGAVALPAPVDLTALGVLAAEAVARAIRNGVRAADGTRTPGLPAWREWPA